MINQISDSFIKMSGAFDDLSSRASALIKNFSLIDSGVTDVSIIQNNLQMIVNRQEIEINSADSLDSLVDSFIEDTISADEKSAEIIQSRKNEFYKMYSYLKPECEKNGWEKFKDGCKKVGDWCKEHWKFIVTAVIVITAVILLVSGVGTGLGAAILAGACWGAISGAVVGGVVGGIVSSLQGGSFFEGFESGAFDGAIGGAIGGAITGGLTFIVGPSSTLWASIGRTAAIEAGSSGVSNMCVTSINYITTNGTLKGAWDDILLSGLSGAISGAISGGITGGFIHIKTQLKVSNSKFLTEDGKINWEKFAPNNGRVEGSVLENQTLKKGIIIDRYGSKYGNYTSPVDTSFEARALPYDNNSWAYHKYEVIRDIDGITLSEIAPAFDQPGGGIQYELPDSVKNLVKNGFLKEIFF